MRATAAGKDLPLLRHRQRVQVPAGDGHVAARTPLPASACPRLALPLALEQQPAPSFADNGSLPEAGSAAADSTSPQALRSRRQVSDRSGVVPAKRLTWRSSCVLPSAPHRLWWWGEEESCSS